MQILRTPVLRIDDDGQRVVMTTPFAIRVLAPLGIMAFGTAMFFAVPLLGGDAVQRAMMRGLGILACLSGVYALTLGRSRLGAPVVFDRTSGIVRIGSRELLPGRIARLWIEDREAAGYALGAALLAEVEGRRVPLGRAVPSRHRGELERLASGVAAVVLPAGRDTDPATRRRRTGRPRRARGRGEGESWRG